MKIEENFNDILKSKFGNWKHPVDEANWKEMRTIIDNSRKGKRRIVLAAVSLSAILACAGIYMLNNNSQSSVGLGQSRMLSGAETSVSSDQSSANSTSARVKQHEATVSAQNENASGTNPGNIQSSESYTGNSASGIGSSSALRKSNRANRGGSNKPGAQSLASGRSALYGRNSSPASGSLQQPDETQLQTATDNNPNSNAERATNNQSQSSKTANARPTIAVKGSTLVASKGKRKVRSLDTAGMNGNPFSASNAPVKKNFLDVELGIDYHPGWVVDGKSQGASTNLMVGVGWTRKLNYRWGLKTGLQISAYGGLGTLPYNTTHVEESGTVYDYSSVTTNRLFYATVPLQIEYTINRDAAFGIGGTFSYLFTSYGSSEDYTESIAPVNTIVTSQNSGGFLAAKGYNPWNSSVDAFYKRHFLKKFAVYGMAYYGLSNMQENSYFMRNISTKDYGLKITFTYTIF